MAPFNASKKLIPSTVFFGRGALRQPTELLEQINNLGILIYFGVGCLQPYAENVNIAHIVRKKDNNIWAIVFFVTRG